MDLTDDQWKIVSTILPKDPVREDKRGRPWSDRRTVLNGVLWILRTGAPWKDLPGRYGPYQTAHRRFQNWVRSGVIEKILIALAAHLKEAGGLDLKECFVDGTFVPLKKGALRRKNQAWQGDQDHGHCRRPWSSYRPADRKRFAC
jgi:transposase